MFVTANISRAKSLYHECTMGLMVNRLLMIHRILSVVCFLTTIYSTSGEEAGPHLSDDERSQLFMSARKHSFLEMSDSSAATGHDQQHHSSNSSDTRTGHTSRATSSATMLDGTADATSDRSQKQGAQVAPRGNKQLQQQQQSGQSVLSASALKKSTAATARSDQDRHAATAASSTASLEISGTMIGQSHTAATAATGSNSAAAALRQSGTVRYDTAHHTHGAGAAQARRGSTQSSLSDSSVHSQSHHTADGSISNGAGDQAPLNKSSSQQQQTGTQKAAAIARLKAAAERARQHINRSSMDSTNSNNNSYGAATDGTAGNTDDAHGDTAAADDDDAAYGGTSGHAARYHAGVTGRAANVSSGAHVHQQQATGSATSKHPGSQRNAAATGGAKLTKATATAGAANGTKSSSRVVPIDFNALQRSAEALHASAHSYDSKGEQHISRSKFNLCGVWKTYYENAPAHRRSV